MKRAIQPAGETPRVPANTRVCYRYRDANNCKEGGEVVLAGRFSEADMEAIRRTLDDGIWFIPTEVGWPPLQTLGGGELTDADHVWHELTWDDEFDVVPTDAPATHGSVEAAVTRFCAARWDEERASAAIGLPSGE